MNSLQRVQIFLKIKEMAVDIIFELCGQFVGWGWRGERLRQRVGSELRRSWDILVN